MKVYVHEGLGHYQASVVVVIAASEAAAETKIRIYLDGAGLRDVPVKIVNSFDTDRSGMVFADNGG